MDLNPPKSLETITSVADEVDAPSGQQLSPSGAGLRPDQASFSQTLDRGVQILLKEIVHVPPHGC